MEPLHIDGNYYLNRDKYNWILQEAFRQTKRKNPETGELEEITDGEIRYRDLGYFPDLSVLCTRVANLQVKAESVDTLKSLVQATERLAAALEAQAESRLTA